MCTGDVGCVLAAHWLPTVRGALPMPSRTHVSWAPPTRTPTSWCLPTYSRCSAALNTSMSICTGVASTAHQSPWRSVVKRVCLRSHASVVSYLLRDTSQSFAATQRPVRFNRYGAHTLLTIVHIYGMCVMNIVDDGFIGGRESSVHTQTENAHGRRWITAACTSRGRRSDRVSRCIDCSAD